MVEPLAERLAGYFYFHGLKGALLDQLGRADEARESFARAIALANTPAEAAHIRQHLDRLSTSPPQGEENFSPLSDSMSARSSSGHGHRGERHDRS